MGTPGTSFRSLYRHGFARVAACTARCTLADPAANAAAILRLQQALPRPTAWRWRCFPSCRVSGYAIDDLLLQDAAAATPSSRRSLTLIARSARTAAGAGGRRAAAPRRAALQLRGGDPSRPAAGRGAQGAPAELSRILREAPFRVGRRHRRAVHHHRPRTSAPFGPDLLFSAEDLPGLTIHAGDLRGRLGADAAQQRSARWPARRCWRTCRPATSPSARRTCAGCCAQSQSARCLAAYLYAAAGTGEVDHRPGVGRPGLDLRERRDARRDAALPGRGAARRRRRRPRPAAPGAAAHGQLRRQPTAPRRRCRRVPPGHVPPGAAAHGDLGLQRRARALPVRARRPAARSSRTATRPTTSRSPA